MKILKGSADYFRYIKNNSGNEVDYLMINLAFNCNYRCLKCCNYERLIRFSKKPIMTIDIIKEQIIKCQQLGIKAVGIMGEGEPLLDKDFKELAQFISDQGLIFYVFTNGSMLDESMINFLSDKDVSLIINIDSLQAARYDKWVKKDGALKILLENITKIRKVYKNKIFKKNGYVVTSLGVNMVINKENYQEIKAINEFCGSDIFFTINKPILAGNLLNHQEKYTQAIENEESLFRPLGTLKEVDECYYLTKGISLSAQGFIIPCPYTVEATGLLGYGLDAKNILENQQKVLKIVANFYQKYGHARCLVRHPQYNKFNIF